jgi:hypothetical protein
LPLSRQNTTPRQTDLSWPALNKQTETRSGQISG